MTAYVINSIAWAVLGLLVGYVIGRGARAALALEKAAAMTDPAPARVTWWSRVARPTPDQILGVIVVVLAIASVAVMAVSVSHQQTQIDKAQASIRCQTQFNAAFAAALNERTDAAGQERQAQRDLLTSVLVTRSPAEGGEAIRRYLGRLADADAQRAANPLPVQPSCEQP